MCWTVRPGGGHCLKLVSHLPMPTPLLRVPGRGRLGPWAAERPVAVGIPGTPTGLPTEGSWGMIERRDGGKAQPTTRT